ncbi:MAG: HAMP domain-containing sensor histidine kinase [Gammaproteobacteria bacterium]|nr:HAMP domain-containing sensor histidine kinase [Gammaproteobacteria bacterium]
MNLGKVLTSFTFRYMLLYVVSLSFAVFLLMVFIYGIFAYNYFEDLQDSIVGELETLTLIYEGQGVAGVEQYIADQQQGAGKFHYLLTDAEFNKVTGTLESWPGYREFGDGWVSFGLDATDLVGKVPALELLARPQVLSNGYHLLAALRYNDILESNRLVMKILFRTMLATLALGVVGGYFSAAFTLRRVERVNEGISDIVRGDLSQRIPLGDAAGNVRELIENFNDMLDQTQSLMQGVRTLSDNIAHDLRTPLTRMRNNLSLLERELQGEEEGRVQQLIAECDEILTTFNALLRIAQLEAGNRISVFAPVNLGALVQDVVELYEPLAQEKQVEVHVHCEPLGFDGDRDLLFQMAANLLDNAVKYTSNGGAISVAVTGSERDKVILTVADDGPGIPVADRENVFRRFFRLESSRGVQSGSGLGLSLVQAVVKMHRGSIRLLDNHPGLRVEVSLG